MYRVAASNLLLLLVFCAQAAHSAENPVSHTRHSDALQEQRTFNVILPDNYEAETEQRFEVIVVTDGEWHTDTVSFVQRFARGNGFVPPAIIVGIPNVYPDGANQRDRDFLPGPGADAFISFLADEVLPAVDKQYRTTGERTLVGHSHGGTFVTYTLFTRPELFNSYIATDPSLWWDDRALVRQAAEALPQLEGLNRTYWMAGIDRTAGQNGIEAMAGTLQQHAPAGFTWKHAVYANEVHNSVSFKGFYDGLKFTYAGHGGPEVIFHPMAGTVVDGQPFSVWKFNEYGNARYTLDGSAPTRASEEMAAETVLNGPAELRASMMASRGDNNAVTLGVFSEGQAFPASAFPADMAAGGLGYRWFPATRDGLSAFGELEPVAFGRGGLEPDPVIRQQQFEQTATQRLGLVVDGYFRAEAPGYYVFILRAGEEARLKIDDRVILHVNGTNATAEEVSYIVALEEGFHAIHLETLQATGDSGHILRYVVPGQAAPTPVPLALLYAQE